jgi:PilZ domain
VTSQYTTSSVERRRHVRQRTRSIVCVKLDNDNGGILLNLGTRGLSFQAVAPLDPEQDLILHFMLFDTGETIEVTGRVAWLGRTRKEAGICFTDPPDRTMQRISEWIALQEAPSDTTESKVASSANPVPAPSEIPLPPSQFSVQLNPSLRMVSEPQPTSSTAPPSESILGDALPDHAASRPSAPLAFGPSLPSPIPTYPLRYEEHSAASMAYPAEQYSETLNPIVHPELPSPSGHSEVGSRRDRAVPNPPKLLSSTDAVSGNVWIPPVPILSPPERKRSRQRLLLAGLASCVGILALIVMSTDHRKYQEKTDSSAAPVLNVSPPTSMPPGGPAAGTTLQSQEMPSHPRQQTSASAAAPSASVSTHTPIPAPPKIVRRSTEAQWVALFRKIVQGIDGTSPSNPTLVGVPVWTDGRSGYYYCANSPYFEKLEPGSIMTQANALQSGYQPKLGSYCH